MGINDKILVTGAGGFIGGALVPLLRKQGFRDIRAVDVKPLDEWYQRFDDVENLSLDLNLKENCERLAKARSRFITWRRIWAGWASSSTTKRCACCLC